MSKETCILTTKDFTILEVMRDRCLGRDDPLAPILKRKIESATVMFRDDIPVNVATLSSRVVFSVNGRDPDTRVISSDRITSPIGMFLPITTARGLALLGLSDGQEFVTTNVDGEEERILLREVLYQPEAARREEEAMRQVATQRKPMLKLIRGAFYDQPRLVPVAPDGFDDPGPSAA
ncbi:MULTISPECIES: nucleoside-diphosphate kinase [unclassified Mesorhizobium]|uniref:nucleoside-diphosphate kinase n=1 Tax=unclassified Mesorhizobium TaxID=325217 RepID=UPI00112872B2|nr:MULTISPECIES: nucleoside-diphosphate kinase [unclassified Mesorhizobium]MBZ9799074.1 nucleoside-diphosphate kinase [Mesorhizobium sp. ES1-4]TPJ38260.1 nucleoside-diphosphate kinase [Mesorhizobium sp. B2-6-5]